MTQRLSGLSMVVALTLFYALGHLVWYLGTPLGQVPVLDERENVGLAAQIATGQLPPEPFYRAMGYPLVLAGFLHLGITLQQLPAVALALGAFLHALNAWLTGRLAMRLFAEPRAGWIAALLTGFNPVLLHYAVSVLDATLGTTFFLLGCLALFANPASSTPTSDQTLTRSSTKTESPILPLLCVSLCWGLATLTRPQFLPVLLALPLLVWVRQRNFSGFLLGGGALAVGGGLFLVQGLWQRQVSGEFRIMPWQGTYNLWAANKPGAHGRYFVQSIFVAQNAAQENPTKLETLALYQEETGLAPRAIDTVNAYWKNRFWSYVSAHPLQWAGLLARKTYALFNNWEQYNNKTYAFHKARSPWLAWNPIGWGVLLLLAVPGGWLLARRQPGDAAALLGLGALYAAGVILFFVSARFRLPLATLLAVLAGGALARPALVLALPRGPLALWLILGAGLTFSRFFGVHDTRPFLADHILLARAAQRTGDDTLAWSEAKAASELEPSSSEAAELLVTSWFNLAMEQSVPLDESVERAATRISSTEPHLASATVTLAEVIHARTGGRSAMLAHWHERGTPDALAALVLSGAATAEETARFSALLLKADDSVLVRLARLPESERPANVRSLFQ